MLSHHRSYQPLTELAGRPEQTQFGTAKGSALPKQCRACSFRPLCHGGCPKNRFARASDGTKTRNYLCPAYKTFFPYIDPYMQVLAGLVNRGYRAARIQEEIRRNPDALAPDDIGRNDPCYCGSGRKYKHCCA